MAWTRNIYLAERFVKSGIRYEAEKNNQLANFNFLPHHGTRDTYGLCAARCMSLNPEIKYFLLT